MEDLYSFLFFVAIIVLNGLFQNAKRKARKKKTNLPPPQDMPQIPKQKQKQEQTLDYMMAKPTQKQTVEAIYTEPEFIKEEPVIQRDINNVYQEYLKRNDEYQKNKDKDYIQQTQIETNDTKKKMQINIEREHIMNAIMYAQVLEMPKSVYYLKRYNIRRIIHKD